MAEQDSVTQAKNYVSSLKDSCSYQNGYSCADVKENTFMTREGMAQLMPASYLEASAVALANFKTIEDLSAEQKKMKHYKVGLTEDADHYIVYFNALMLPQLDANGKPVGIMRVTFGRSTKYWISKKDLSIQKRLFMK